MRTWRFWLIDGPAAIVTIWFFLYRVLMTIMTIITVSVVVLMLVLWAGFGIRWGW